MEIWDGPEVGGRTFVPLKHRGWCNAYGVEHAYAELPRVVTDDPRRRWCVNCGHTQKLEPPPTVVILKWVDEMSSLPGLTLEAFLMWNYDLIVAGDGSANVSLELAETFGTANGKRREITKQQFAPIVELYEPYRDQIQEKLADFDVDSQSWRDYAGYSFSFIPASYYDKAVMLLMGVTTAKEVTAEYTRQILKAVVPGLTIKDDCDTFYQVNELLKLYGATAYSQGQQHLVEKISKLVDD